MESTAEAPAEYRGQAARTDWASHTDGRWWLFRDDQAGDNRRANDRIRVAAHMWAKGRGLRVRSRTEDGGQKLFLRFEKAE